MSDHGDSYAAWGHGNAMAAHRAQGGQLQGMANQAMGAIARENESRKALADDLRERQYRQWLTEQQLYLQWARVNNERERQNNDAANQIRALKYRAYRDQLASGQPATRRFRRDPATGEYRWMAEWEM